MGTFVTLAVVVIAILIIGVVMANSISLKNSDGEIYDNFVSGNSFGSIGANVAVKGVLKSDCLYIYEDWHEDVNVSLPYHKITGVKLTSDVEIIERSKSVAGRAIVGGLVLGAAGALFGGLSGIGSKQERQASNYILISYRPSNDEEEHGILLKVGVSAWSKFMEKLKEKANIVEEKSVGL